MAQLPVGTVTFLFTDVEDSTRLWQEQPDDTGDALRRLDSLMLHAVESHDGHIVKNTGDGAFAVFDSPSQAIDAAIAVQLAIEAEDWQLRVRIGMHSGPAERRDDDYFGISVTRAARVADAAHGGQIVLSGVTRELSGDSPAETLDLGEHHLKGVERPERIFQVLHPDLDTKFPPLRSENRLRSNLPVASSRFVGREQALGAVKGALTDTRLVTLTGVGGVGKTRLALQAATELAAEFPDGVWLIELAAVGDPAAVAGAVATTMGLVPQPGRTTTESVVEAVAGRRTLVVLDNCEHVLDAAADLIQAVLARPGPAKILATSREGMGVEGEHLWPVPSLGSRDDDADAVALFIDRARAVSPDLAFDSQETIEAISEICVRLDGIPLAIELAAARTIAMSPAELRERLNDRFRLLSGSRRGLERHQTLRQAVQWSYDLLSTEERDLLDRCAVFAGGFDLDAAVAISGDSADEYAVLDGLDALVRKSLLAADRSTGRTRYSMLETIRHFAEERLGAAGTLPELQSRHSRHFAQLARDTLAAMADGGGTEGVEALLADWGNYRAGFRTAADDGDLGTAAAIALHATEFGFMFERHESAAWAEELLAVASAEGHQLLGGLYSAAAMCAATGRIGDAFGYAEEALALLQSGQSAGTLVTGASTLVASPYAFVGRADRWVDFCRAEIAASERSRPLRKANLLVALALAGQTAEAVALADDTVAETAASGVKWWQATALLGYSLALFDTDRPASLTAIRRAHGIMRALPFDFAGNFAILARIEAAHGDPTAALDACAEALRIYKATGDRVSASTPHWVLADLLHRADQNEAAAIVAGSGLGPDLVGYVGLVMLFPELAATIDDLRSTLGDETFETLAHQGAAMDNTNVFNFALEQIDAARSMMQTDRNMSSPRGESNS